MDDHNDKHILKAALKIAADLMDIANNEDVLRDDTYCGILAGVMRDCAYKIVGQAERECQAQRVKSQQGPCILKMQPARHFNLKKLIMILGAVLILGAAAATPVNATIILSTDATETIGGLTFYDGDLAEYNPTTDTATLYFDENLFSSGGDIDAIHVLDNGNIILSTASSATLGGLSFNDGDLVEYNPTTDTATLFFSESLFSGDEDIGAVHILDSGNIILSTMDGATLGGLSFTDGDLIEYNPTTNTATLFFDGILFDGSEDIDAVHILENGNIIVSTVGAAMLGGLTFQNGDLAEYNPTADIATLYFSESLFSNNSNIDGVYITTVPEPATIALLGLGGAVVLAARRRRA